MSEKTPSNVTEIPLEKKSFFTKTNAIRVGVAALAVTAVVVVVIVKMKTNASPEALETLVETTQV